MSTVKRRIIQPEHPNFTHEKFKKHQDTVVNIVCVPNIFLNEKNQYNKNKYKSINNTSVKSNRGLYNLN